MCRVETAELAFELLGQTADPEMDDDLNLKLRLSYDGDPFVQQW